MFLGGWVWHKLLNCEIVKKFEKMEVSSDSTVNSGGQLKTQVVFFVTLCSYLQQHNGNNEATHCFVVNNLP